MTVNNTHNNSSSIMVSSISTSLMNIVANVLSYAWYELQEEVASGDFSICDAKEDCITEKLICIISELHESNQIPGFDKFQIPERGARIPDRSGNMLNSEPDIPFRPINMPPGASRRFYAIIVECKIIGSKHYSVKSNYCDMGISRFVKNQYAWSVDQGMMLGYVRNNFKLPENLKSMLDSAAAKQEYKTDGELHQGKPTDQGYQVFTSIHQRCKSQPITNHHLWLHPETP